MMYNKRLYKLSRFLLTFCIDLAKYQWFRKKVGGRWYYVSLLVDLGRQKIYWWTKTELPKHYIREIEDYEGT